MTMKNNTLIVLLLLLLPTLCFAEDAADQCYDHLFAMPELIPIANKMGFPDISKTSFEQLANTDKATDNEKPLISKYAEGAKICSDLAMSLQPQRLHPKAKKREEDNANNRVTLLIDLYTQKISYGEFIKFRLEAIAKSRREWEELSAEINENNAREEAMQGARNNKAWADLFNGLAEGVRNSRPPSAINCNPNGFGGVRCQ